MARTKGTYSLSANIEPRAAAPLDAREKVALISDLTTANTFPYPYEGMKVYCEEDKKLYILTGSDPTVAANWNEVGSGGSQTLAGLDDVDINLIEWSPKTWTGLTSFSGVYIWSDGDSIYYSYGSDQYVLDKSTSTWSPKTWLGITSFYGAYIWSDGDSIYYSYGSDQYVLDKSTSTWSPKTWTGLGLTSFNGIYIWSDGDSIYYSYGSDQYVLDKSTSTWSTKTWLGISQTDLSNLRGNCIWSDGNNFYYSYLYGDAKCQYVLDKSTSTWSPKTWSGLTEFIGSNIWTDGANIYYSDGINAQYVLNKSTSTWLPKTWTGRSSSEFFAQNIWTDGNNIYSSRDSRHYKLNHTDEALIYDWANQKWVNKEILSKEDIPKTFTGTRAEWDILPTSEKIKWQYTAFTDDEGGGTPTDVSSRMSFNSGYTFTNRQSLLKDGVVYLNGTVNLATPVQIVNSSIGTHQFDLTKNISFVCFVYGDGYLCGTGTITFSTAKNINLVAYFNASPTGQLIKSVTFSGSFVIA